MSGICLTPDLLKQKNLNRLFNNHSIEDFQILNESQIGKDLIDSEAFDMFKHAKEHNSPELLHFVSRVSLEKLFELALLRDRLWPIGKTISVNFLDRNPILEKKIISFANEWAQYANIKFEFTESGNAEVRISLRADGCSWSKLGTYASDDKNPSSPTIHFGWFNNFTPDIEIRRTTLHEFGHALGCVHEHQTIASPIKWDVDVVYRVYSTYGWSKAMVDHNVFKVYTQNEITNTIFDRDSIMIYPIPSILTLDGTSIELNTELSEIDKRFIGECYPK
jgi:hypothetical protein